MLLIGFFEPLTLNNTTCLDYSRVIRPVPMGWIGVAGFTGGAKGGVGRASRWEDEWGDILVGLLYGAGALGGAGVPVRLP